MYLYIHGYKSSGLSFKARHFRSFFQGKLFAPTLSENPRLALDTLEQFIELNQVKGLIGSSLGGLFAIYLAEKYAVPAVLLNPAIPPWEDLTLEDVGRGAFVWTDEHLEVLRPLRVEKPKLANYLLIQEENDEIIHYGLAQKYLQGAQQVLGTTGGHSISNIADYDLAIAEFLRKFNEQNS